MRDQSSLPVNSRTVNSFTDDGDDGDGDGTLNRLSSTTLAATVVGRWRRHHSLSSPQRDGRMTRGVGTQGRCCGFHGDLDAVVAGRGRPSRGRQSPLLMSVPAGNGGGGGGRRRDPQSHSGVTEKDDGHLLGQPVAISAAMAGERRPLSVTALPFFPSVELAWGGRRRPSLTKYPFKNYHLFAHLGFVKGYAQTSPVFIFFGIYISQRVKIPLPGSVNEPLHSLQPDVGGSRGPGT